MVVSTGEIRLSYYKQGDDLNNCLAYLDTQKTKIDISQTITNHLALLQSAISQLSQIQQLYQEMNPPDVSLEGDSHYIGISGPVSFMTKLIGENLVDKDPFESETSSQMSEQAYEKEVEDHFSEMINNSTTDYFDESDTEMEHHIGSEIIHQSLQSIA